MRQWTLPIALAGATVLTGVAATGTFWLKSSTACAPAALPAPALVAAPVVQPAPAPTPAAAAVATTQPAFTPGQPMLDPKPALDPTPPQAGGSAPAAAQPAGTQPTGDAVGPPPLAPGNPLAQPPVLQ